MYELTLNKTPIAFSVASVNDFPKQSCCTKNEVFY